MRSKNTLFLNVALISGLFYPAMVLAEGSSSGFCLKTCTKKYCATSQENYQHCRDLCRGKYDGLIKSCKKSAQDVGFIDEKINNKAKFRPCPLAMKETPSGDGKAREEKHSTSSESSDAHKAPSSDSDATAEASEKGDTSAQDGEEGTADQESAHEEKVEAPSDDDDKSAEGEEA